jgi:hypothetical protein
MQKKIKLFNDGFFGNAARFTRVHSNISEPFLSDYLFHACFLMREFMKFEESGNSTSVL